MTRPTAQIPGHILPGNGIGVLIEPQVRAKQLDYVVEARGADVRAYAEPERLEQIVLNLLSNAVKFSRPGDQVRICGETNGNRVAVHVIDTGEGIPADKIDVSLSWAAVRRLPSGCRTTRNRNEPGDGTDG
jgi:signal transduction histidine kinase